MMTADQEKMKDSGLIYCAHCGTENPEGTYSCDRCGERIYLPDPLKPPPMGLIECQTCLISNESRAIYCVKCGSSLAGAARISVLGGGGTARHAPHSQPGGIRLRQRDSEPTARPAPTPEREPHRKNPETDYRPRRVEPPVPEAAGTRTREPEKEREQREVARGKAAEQEKQNSEASEGVNDSGTRSARLPKAERGWNAAAFLLGPIWGPANGVWLGLFGIIFLVIPESILPLWLKFTLYLAYGAFLGYNGNQFAWRARRWSSLKQFKRVQQQWMIIALVVNLALLVVMPILLRS